VIFVSAMSAQNTVIPIVQDNILLGGVQDGKWISAEQIFLKVKDESQFILISPKGTENMGLAVGRKSQFSTCSDLPDIEIGKKSAIAIGAEAKWNPLPRLSNKIPFTDKNIQKIALDFLKSRKIVAAKVEIGQSFEVDIDGDGSMETLIAADYYENTDSLETRSVGDYSFVLLRKMVNGQPQNILIDGEFFTKANLSGSTDVRSISLIADLNGDGIMEIILTVDHQEGFWNRIYQLNQNQSTKVLEVGCGF
jgi:hypothetical protein